MRRRKDGPLLKPLRFRWLVSRDVSSIQSSVTIIFGSEVHNHEPSGQRFERHINHLREAEAVEAEARKDAEVEALQRGV